MQNMTLYAASDRYQVIHVTEKKNNWSHKYLKKWYK